MLKEQGQIPVRCDSVSGMGRLVASRARCPRRVRTGRREPIGSSSPAAVADPHASPQPKDDAHAQHMLDHDHDHDHGKAMPEAPADPMPVPANVAQQFRALEQAAAEVAWAGRREDVPDIRESFRRIGQALDQVEGERLTGHASMVWNGLHMLLGNDAVEGGQVERLSDARRVLDGLARDLRRVREQFDLDADPSDEHRHGS